MIYKQRRLFLFVCQCQ